MASVSSQLAALCDKIQALAEPGTDMSLRQVSMACICIATHNLGNAAVPSRITRTRKSLPPVSTLQFRVDNEEYLIMEGDRGFVYKVYHRMTFALKSLFRELGEDDDEEAAAILNLHVLREACFMAACRGHPSLVRFYAVGKFPVPDQYFLLIEHVVDRPTACWQGVGVAAASSGGPSIKLLIWRCGNANLIEQENVQYKS
ncbi:hypothetical protein PR202_ga05268 [Eleusine coracana subsp. coracana]|uniref:Protein kinase domain-containing protein n=1 Tax=Eleusine coracana subsp. coracana TaxID=191504 RepID=A0AAV5BS66_ELECO|nr:hypothetical protein PR202_ga04814 [Eleusine coracana subsp. coracana]GJM89119.1 hypothetical protein PR202_ga05268 [Eleusine coracana subsp. coracana]